MHYKRFGMLLAGIALLAATIGGAGLAAAPAGASKHSTGPRRGGTLKVGLTAAMTTLDPLPFGAKSYFLLHLLYNTAIVATGAKFEPGLVQSWSFAKGGTSMTLHIRPGVRYTDGTPFNATALVWNINWEKLPATGSSSLSLWEDVTATADGSDIVDLKFSQALPEILGMLAAAPMVKPNAPTSGIGTGPFKVKAFTPGQSLTVVKNPSYWVKGKPYLDGIDFTNYSQTTTAALALRASTIDMMLLPSPTQVASLKSDGDTLLKGTGSNDGYQPGALYCLLLNSSTAPLNNVKVRQALSLAFNRKQFVSTILDGLGTPAESFFIKGSPGYHASPTTMSYDLKKAASLLKQAHVSHLTLSIDAVTVVPETKFLPVYQQDLAKIGVKLTIDDIDTATWATIAPTGDFPDMLTQAEGFSFPDPSIALSTPNYRTTANSEHFSSPKYTSLIHAAAITTATAKRQADLKAVNEYLEQQSFIIPLAYGTSPVAAYSPTVSGGRVVLGGGADTPTFTVLSMR